MIVKLAPILGCGPARLSCSSLGSKIRPVMPIRFPMVLASRQADLMDRVVTDNGVYWPEGFFKELLAMFEGNAEKEFRSGRLEEMCSRAAEEFAAGLIADPRGVLSETAAQQAAFEARLEARWGRGLDLADLVVWDAFESGRWVNEILRPAATTRQDQKFEALIRLHGKAVMTAREVLVLLRGGYSSGALARWRTLHEVLVVFLVLVDGDGELSRRYLVHEVVEGLKGQKEYEETWEALGLEPPDWTAAEREQALRDLVSEFDRTFLQGYGWAAPLFNNRAKKFKELQEYVSLDHWRGYYRMASHGTHANSKGISWNIQGSATVDVDVVWAGPSNMGLLDPAQCTLIALANVTASLLGYAVGELRESADGVLEQSNALVRQRSIFLLRDHAIATLAEVHSQLETEEEAVSDLVSRATAVLREGDPMTAEDLAAELKVDPETLAEILDRALASGELVQQTHYRIEG